MLHDGGPRIRPNLVLLVGTLLLLTILSSTFGAGDGTVNVKRLTTLPTAEPSEVKPDPVNPSSPVDVEDNDSGTDNVTLRSVVMTKPSRATQKAAVSAVVVRRRPFSKAGSWPADIISHCLSMRKGAEDFDQSVTFLSYGDSFGREMVESLLQRSDPGTFRTKHHDAFDIELPIQRRVFVQQTFRPRASAIPARSIIRRSKKDRIHLLLARGAADIIHYATPLPVVYNETLAVLRDAATSRGVVTITYRLTHRFTSPAAVHQRECTGGATFDAYRRTAACAVAAFNSRQGGVRALLIDPDPIVQEHHLEGDGVHIGLRNAGTLMDALLLHHVCPVLKQPRSNPMSKLFTSQSGTEISSRYNCSTLDVLRLDRDLPPRYGCRCSAEDGTALNDQCGITFSAFFPTALKYNTVAERVRTYICALRRRRGAVTASTLPGVTNLSAAIVESPQKLTSVIMHLCVAPQDSLELLRSVGYRYAVDEFQPEFLIRQGVECEDASSLSNCRVRRSAVQQQIKWFTHLAPQCGAVSQQPGDCPTLTSPGGREVDACMRITLRLLCHPEWPMVPKAAATAKDLEAQRSAASDVKRRLKKSSLEGTAAVRLSKFLKVSAVEPS